MIKRVRVIGTADASTGASDISELIGEEFDVVEETIVDPDTGAKEVEVILNGIHTTFYPGEYEVIEEDTPSELENNGVQ